MTKEMTKEELQISEGDVTLSEYAELCRDFYWDLGSNHISDLEDSEASSMVRIALNHISIAYNLLEQAHMANFRYLVQQSSNARKMEEAYETTDD